VMREDPSFKPNPDFARDMFNIVVGIAWQTSLVAFPVYIVIRRYDISAYAMVVVAVTSTILKFTWYDHLKKMEVEPVTMPVALPAVHP
jgi:SSS family solute:Na+ symporter